MQRNGKLVEVPVSGASQSVAPYVQPDTPMGRRQMREHMRRTGEVPVQEHRDVMKDHERRREYRRQEEARERKRDVVNVIKGYGL